MTEYLSERSMLAARAQKAGVCVGFDAVGEVE
jgi:hypothetical protein